MTYLVTAIASDTAAMTASAEATTPTLIRRRRTGCFGSPARGRSDRSADRTATGLWLAGAMSVGSGWAAGLRLTSWTGLTACSDSMAPLTLWVTGLAASVRLGPDAVARRSGLLACSWSCPTASPRSVRTAARIRCRSSSESTGCAGGAGLAPAAPRTR